MDALESTESSQEQECVSMIAAIDEAKVRFDIHLDEEGRPLPNNRGGFRSVGKFFRII